MCVLRGGTCVVAARRGLENNFEELVLLISRIELSRLASTSPAEHSPSSTIRAIKNKKTKQGSV